MLLLYLQEVVCGNDGGGGLMKEMMVFSEKQCGVDIVTLSNLQSSILIRCH